MFPSCLQDSTPGAALPAHRGRDGYDTKPEFLEVVAVVAHRLREDCTVPQEAGACQWVDRRRARFARITSTVFRLSHSTAPTRMAASRRLGFRS